MINKLNYFFSINVWAPNVVGRAFLAGMCSRLQYSIVRVSGFFTGLSQQVWT